jgi:hypothetical protein
MSQLNTHKAKAVSKRPIGLAKGEFTVPDSFFDELPDDYLHLFQGDAVLMTPDPVIHSYPVKTVW